MNQYVKGISALTALVVLGASSIAFSEVPAGVQKMTRNNGAPVGDNQNTQTAGPNGPTLIQDTHFLEKLATFDRERIPERVVHARGVGAYGEFESFEDLSDLTMAAPLQSKGKKTPVFVRFSTVIHPQGSPEALRDPRGFATRFYSEQGNWDIVGNNLPIFFIRDAIKFPDMIHSLKPSPVTNIQEPGRAFDFFSHQPESTHMLTQVYSNLGTPRTHRHQNGFGVHAFKLVNAKGEYKYVKFNWHTRQGIQSFTAKEAAAADFNVHTKDLYDAIAKGDYPSWDLYIQVLDPKDLNSFEFNPLDDTKIWPTNLVPERLVGRMTLNRTPKNFFNDTERYAPAPSNMIPGVEASEDRMLQGRMFSYADTQRYRLGINHQQFPVNKPHVDVVNGNRDGVGNMREQEGDVNYQPSRRAGAYAEDTNYRWARTPLTGTTQQQPIEKTLHFKQAGDFYRALPEYDKSQLISNLVGDLSQVKEPETTNIMVSHFYKADKDYGTRLAKALKLNLATIQKLADQLSE